MIGSIKRKILYSILFAIIALAIEYINFRMIGFGFFPKYFLMNLAFIFYLIFMTMLIPLPELQFWTQSLILMLHIVISVVNYNLRAITGEVFFWDMLALIQDGVQALEGTNILDLSSLWFYGGLFIIYQGIHILIYVKRIKGVKLSKYERIRYLITVFTISLGLYLSGFMLNHLLYVDLANQVKGADEETILLSEAYLYETMFQPESSISSLEIIFTKASAGIVD